VPDSAVLEIIHAREKVRNALDLATTERLIGSIAQARADDKVRAVLLRGEGAGFCAGSDVKEMAAASMPERLRIAERKALLMRDLAELDKPVVCAVQGFALGGGFMLAIGCDVVLTSPGSAWRLPEVGLGFFPPWGIEALLRRVGIARARNLVWGAKPLSGAEAVLFGLADEEASADALLDSAREAARELAALPVDSARATKRFFREQVPVPGLDTLAREVYRLNCEAGSAEQGFARFKRPEG